MYHRRGSLSKGRLIFTALLVLVALALSFTSATAYDDPPSGLTMEVEATFDGYFKYGEWLPIWVYLENDGPDLEAEVQVQIASGNTTTFAAPASLPTGSRKRIPLYVLPNNYSHELEVRLVDDDEVLLVQSVPINPRPNVTYFVGLIASQRGGLAMLQGISTTLQDRPKEIIDLSLIDLAERPEGLRTFDCLILNDVDTLTLTPEQKTALEAWVHQGGQLVIGGGSGVLRTVAGLPESLLPLSPRDTTEVTALPELADFARAEEIRVPGPFVVATGQAEEGHTLASQNGMPLVHERPISGGVVDFVALDLSTAPFDAWSGTTAFWERLLSPSATYPGWMVRDVSPRQAQAGPMSYALSNLPSLDLPSVRGLGILLIVYIILIGPVNYLVLRWRNRLHWAWVTVPLLTIVFSAGAFGLGYALRGTDLVLNKIAIVGLHSDGTANVSSYVGIFSPSLQSYEIEVKGDSLIAPLDSTYDSRGASSINIPGEIVFLQSEPGRVRGLTVNQWSMQTFMTESTWPNLGRIVENLHFEGDQVVGTVRNETDHTLTDAVIVLDQQFVRLGDIPPRMEVPVAMNLSSLGQQVFGPPFAYRLFEELYTNRSGPPPRDVQLKQTMLESIFREGYQPWSSKAFVGDSGTLKGLILIGWLDEAPPDVRVDGQEPAQETTALLFTALSFHLADEGPVSLPPGVIPSTLVQMPVEGGTCGSVGNSIWLGRGEAIFSFHLPEALQSVQVETLQLQLATDGGNQPLPDIAVYNWDTHEWLALDKPTVGINSISNTPGLIADNLVHIRLSVSGNQPGGCFYLSLGVEATR